jgi:endonuclease/exonuclease/phosphatase family metal-dependent hydrolase
MVVVKYMKTVSKILMVLSVACACACTNGRNAGKVTLKVMSYNIRYDNPSDGENMWDIRKPATKEMIYDLRPDVFGVQEAMVHQVRYIEENCPEYLSVGVGRDDGKEGGEFMSIFYDKEKIRLNDWGTIWLSETPEVPSLGWDAWCPRTATWAKLELIESGRKFFYVNTHLDHGGRNARKNSLDLIISLIQKKNTEDVPVILTGDFNVTPDNMFTLESLHAYMNNASATASEGDSVPTNNAFGKREGKIIDYIWWKGFSSCREYLVAIKEYSGIKYISDHWPVLSEMEF